MPDIFKGFLVLRLIGLLALLIVAGLVLGIRSLARGSDLTGTAILAGVLVLAAALRALFTRRAAASAHRRGPGTSPPPSP